MNDQTFNTRLAHLEASIHKLPAAQRDRLMKLTEETQHRHLEIREAIEKRNEYMGRMQLAMSYLLFDLEATKRENSEMKQRLTQLGETGDDSDSRPN